MQTEQSTASSSANPVLHESNIKFYLAPEPSKGMRLGIFADSRSGLEGISVTRIVYEPGGHSVLHSHQPEEAKYIIRGKGVVEIDGRKLPVKAGDLLIVPPNAVHMTKNTGQEPLEAIMVYSPGGHEKLFESWQEYKKSPRVRH